MDLLDRFYQGDYQGVVSETIDSPAGLSHPSQAPAVIASLTFLGRLQEAEMLFEKTALELNAPQRVMCRFFLGVVKCRHFQFQVARRYFGANRAEVRACIDTLSSEERERVHFYLYQGFGFYRYTYGHLRVAHRWARKSYDASFKGEFLFGRLFAQDLLAHVEINLGRTHLGLKLIDQNIALARNLGRGALIQMFKVTRAIYRSRFGIAPRESVEELLTTLSETVFEDGYSRACLLAELSQQYLLRGNARKAGESLNAACNCVYQVDNPRLEILLNFRMSSLLARKGEGAQAMHLVQSSLRRLEQNVDRLLELRVLGFERKLAGQLGRAEGAADKAQRLERLTAKTGYFVGRRILARERGAYFSESLQLQDPLGDLLDDLKRGNPECLSTVLEQGWYGYLYEMCQVDVTQKTVLLGLEGRSLTWFHGGNVTHLPRGASNLTARFLEALAPGERTKEELVRAVWEQSYHPLRHDPLIYSLVSKLRKELGSEAHWVEATENGYQLERGVVVRRFEGWATAAAPEAVPVGPVGEEGLTFRQKQLLRLAERLHYVDVKSCMEAFKVSPATATRDLAYLSEAGFLFRSGRGRSTRYHLSETGGVS